MDCKILLCGDSAVSVVMGDEISLDVNRLVLRLQKSLDEHPVEGIIEVIPSYSSLMIQYDPMILSYENLCEEIQKHADDMPEIEDKNTLVKEIPICYEGELGPDLEECARLQGCSTEEVIRMHSSHLYYVYMLGFAPGHPYAARFEEPFAFKRRPEPRLKIPGRSVVVQQNLSDLIPFDQPCGWNIIGTTPLNITDFSRKDPFLVYAGEWTRYIPVSRSEYDLIRKDVEAGTYQVKAYKKEAAEK
ncbi:5-oxoprolinase subunit PxpB [Eubacterium sp. F2]|uniref:5-oxoprolinase subunit PxpB n=1 Tax=Eubacterium sp. F2 TaxID=3381348 RepID=UPI003908268D